MTNGSVATRRQAKPSKSPIGIQKNAASSSPKTPDAESIRKKKPRIVPKILVAAAFSERARAYGLPEIPDPAKLTAKRRVEALLQRRQLRERDRIGKTGAAFVEKNET